MSRNDPISAGRAAPGPDGSIDDPTAESPGLSAHGFLVLSPPPPGLPVNGEVEAATAPLVGILEEICRHHDVRAGAVAETVRHFLPLATQYLNRALAGIANGRIEARDIFYNSEFRDLLGGPRSIDPRDPDTACYRKRFGARDRGEFVFVAHLPAFTLECSPVVHSHAHPGRWTEHPLFRYHARFATIRHPLSLIAAAAFSPGALGNEYLQRCLDDDQHLLRQELGVAKLTRPDFLEGVVASLETYLTDFLAARDRFPFLLRWENLLAAPIDTIVAVAEAAGLPVGAEWAQELWRRLDPAGLPRWQQRRRREELDEDWKRCLTNRHLRFLRERGFDEHLRALGYAAIEELDESLYTPLQWRIEESLREGRPHHPKIDPNLFNFALDLPDSRPEGNSPRGYPRSAFLSLERSSFKDEAFLDAFRDRMGRAYGEMSGFLGEVRAAALGSSGTEGGALEAVRRRYRPLFEGVFGPASIGNYEEAFRAWDERRARERVPLLEGSHRGYNLIRMNDRCYAVPQVAGAIHLEREDLSRRPEILTDTLLIRLRRRIDRQAAAAPPADRSNGSDPAATRGAEALPELIETFQEHNLVAWKGTIHAIPWSAGPVDLPGVDLAQRPEIFTAASREEIRERIEAARRAAPPPPPVLLESRDGHNLIRYRDAFHAVPQSAGAIDLETADLAQRPEILTETSLEALRERVEAARWAPPSPVPVLIEARGDHNLIRWREGFFAVPHSAGAVDLESVDLARRPEILQAPSLRDLREQVEEVHWATPSPVPVLVETRGEHNIVQWKGVFYSLPHAAGDLDLTGIDPSTYPAVLISFTLAGARRRIDEVPQS